jgi:hypothetical protein
MRHAELDQTVDVISVKGAWVEFVDRQAYNSLRYLEEDVFLEAFRWVRNSPVILSTWADKREDLLAEARQQGIMIPGEFA